MDGIGLYKTETRNRFETVRQDDVHEALGGTLRRAQCADS